MQLKIKEYREEFHLTQKELADKINNVQRNVSNWENGTSEPDCETILKLAELFDISIDELFGREYSAVNKQALNSIELNILRASKQLKEGQKYTLMQFLKELVNG